MMGKIIISNNKIVDSNSTAKQNSQTQLINFDDSNLTPTKLNEESQKQPEECLIRAKKQCFERNNSNGISEPLIKHQGQCEPAKLEKKAENSFLLSLQTSKETDKNGKQQVQQQQQAQTTTNNVAAAQVEATELSPLKKLTLDSLLIIIKTIIALYDLISQPVYYIKHKVHLRQHENERVKRSLQIDPQDLSSPWRQVNTNDARQLQMEDKIDSFETYDEMMRHTFKKFGERPCYGYRSLLHEQWIKRPDSVDKLQRQISLSDYKWITFAQFELQVEAARCGFLLNGIKPGDKVMLYADTRAEWQISSQALIRLGVIVGTMYATLGIEGIVHSVNETQVSHVIAQKDKVSRLLKLKSKLPLLKRIIYFDASLELPKELGGDLVYCDNGDQQQVEEFKHPEVECSRFGKLLIDGLKADKNEINNLEKQRATNNDQEVNTNGQRNKDSIAIIMYTSGSTGIPKGVLISHRNIMATLKSFTFVAQDFVYDPEKHIYAAYLPLAHIFEFCFETLMLFHGIGYGFATPRTLTENSLELAPGQKGDLGLLKPTVLIVVPLVLDRISQGIKQTLRNQSYFKRELINYLIKYKIHWQRRHYKTPLVNKIVCSKMAIALGGRAKFVISGSAPLSGETQAFIRAALNLKLPQGFGTTETCASTSCQTFDDQSIGNVGLPVANSLVKLVAWEEGNYLPSDKPNPRGEIVVGGETVAKGYFNLDEQTAEAFYIDAKGVRWYRTGDIGEFLPNGNLKIIDRKKDLVKLQNGEYISLGKIESTLKSNPYTENLCVYANSAYNYVVALGPANEVRIRSLAQQIVDELSPLRSTNTKNGSQKKAPLLPTEKENLVDELRELLASYENDRLNKNQENEEEEEEEPGKLANVQARKMSSLSVESVGACIDQRLDKLCSNQLVEERVLDFITKLARERNLLNLEIPRKVLLLAEEWTEDKNVVTAAMKIRRNYIYKRYEKKLDELYKQAQVGQV